MKRRIWFFCLLVSINVYAQDHKAKLDSIKGSVDSLLDVENYNAVEFVFESQIKIAKEKGQESTNLLADLYHEYGTYFYNTYEEAKAIKQYKNALVEREKKLEFPHFDLGRTNYMIGLCNSYLDYYYEGIKYFKEAKKNYEGVKELKKVNKCNSDLAEAYSKLGEYQIAEGLYQSVLDYSVKNNKPKSSNTAFYHNKIGEMYFDQKKYSKAKKQFLLAKDIYIWNNQFKEKETYFFNYIANILLEEGQSEEAIKLYKNLVEQKIKAGKEVDPVTAEYYENIGLAYKKEQKFKEAIEWFSKALNIRKQINNDRKSLSLNYSYHNLGDFYLEQGNYQLALINLQKAIKQQVFRFDQDDIFINPSMEEVEILIGSKQLLLKDLKFKGMALYEGYRQSNDIKYLDAARETFMLATQLIDKMRSDFLGSSTQSFWLNETFPIFENAMETSWQLYTLNSSEKIFNDVLNLMEQNKAVLLLEALQKNKSILDQGIPDSLISTHQQLLKKEEIAQSELIELIEDKSEDSQIKEAESQLVQIRKDKAILEEYLRENYSSYNNILRSTFQSKKELLSRFISENQLLIEYFVGDSLTYIAAINKDQHILKTISTAELREVGEELLYVIHPTRIQKAATKDFYKRFTLASHELYRLLLQDILSVFPASIDQLIIVPDEIIAFLPFDAFLQEVANLDTVNYTPDALGYLIKNYSISYTYSATVLNDLLAKEGSAGSLEFLGIAPSFGRQGEDSSRGRACNFESLKDLKNNQPEVEQIQALIGGTVYSGKAADKNTFVKESQAFSILHLATHACADIENSLRNRIFFSDGYLYNHELSNLENQADMVVLSACETGIGEFKRGEGVMSLARGFAYSGTPSITMSLWQVDDASTSELMVGFYEHLKNGASKEVALRNAKLDYFANQEDLFKLHPYFWSAFVHYGDTRPIIKTSKSIWYLGFGIGGIALLFLAWRFFRK